jgi:hypothetical protein
MAVTLPGRANRANVVPNRRDLSPIFQAAREKKRFFAWKVRKGKIGRTLWARRWREDVAIILDVMYRHETM